MSEEKYRLALFWSPGFDMSSIPDKVFRSEKARRNSALRKTKSGGVVWGEHREGYSRCRCINCMTERAEELAAAGPRRKPGRPRTKIAAHPRSAAFIGPKQKQGRPLKVKAVVEPPKPERPRGRPRKAPAETNSAPTPPASVDTIEPIAHDVTQSGLSKYSR
jgi:hypothetical protein